MCRGAAPLLYVAGYWQGNRVGNVVGHLPLFGMEFGNVTVKGPGDGAEVLGALPYNPGKCDSTEHWLVDMELEKGVGAGIAAIDGLREAAFKVAEAGGFWKFFVFSNFPDGNLRLIDMHPEILGVVAGVRLAALGMIFTLERAPDIGTFHQGNRFRCPKGAHRYCSKNCSCV